jgi:hypothetical protein
LPPKHSGTWCLATVEWPVRWPFEIRIDVYKS